MPVPAPELSLAALARNGSTLRELLRHGSVCLTDAGVDTPVLDATVLLAEAVRKSKEALFCSLDDTPGPLERTRYRDYITRRLSHIPVSYIVRSKEFYGLIFAVDERVMVPRPETEIIVDRVSELADPAAGNFSIHDACTGSGCIALALKAHNPSLLITASDVSSMAAEVFALNAERLSSLSTVLFTLTDLLDDLERNFDCITANPPYLTDREYEVMRAAGWPEPELALRGGSDGMAISRRLIREGYGKLNPGGYLLVESSSDQIEPLGNCMRAAGYRQIRVHSDLSGHERVLEGRRGP